MLPRSLKEARSVDSIFILKLWDKRRLLIWSNIPPSKSFGFVTIKLLGKLGEIASNGCCAMSTYTGGLKV